MNITLRHLLAYLDDRLDPQATRVVGEYLESNDQARQLVDRMRRVVRRRRLSTPDVAERSELPPHHEDDPNQVAAYLDGELPRADELAFAEICLDTDVYLAEVTACHQILSLGESIARVPPLARQRMVELVSGPEAQPLRVVPREGRKSKPPLWEVDGKPGMGDEDSQGLLEPLYHHLKQSKWRRVLPAAALLLAATIIGLVMWNWPSRPNQALPEIAQQPASDVEQKTEVAQKPPEVAAPPATQWRAQAVWPMPVMLTEAQPDWQSAPQTLGALTALMASRPAAPGLLLSLGQESTPAVPVIPLPKLDQPRDAVPPPQLQTRIQLGLNSADVPGMFLHTGANGAWQLLRPQSGIFSNELLMALPSYTGPIALQSQVRLMLMGQFSPTPSSQPYEEAVVELHPAADADSDLTVHRGRLIINGRPAAPNSVVRLRYLGESWELTLHPGAEIGVQAFGKALPGENEWQIAYQLDIIVSQGTVEAKRNGYRTPLGPLSQLSWQSKPVDDKPGRVSELTEIPAWIGKRQTAPKEAVDGLVAFRARVHGKVTDDGKDMTWLRLACEESQEERRLVERQEAYLILAATDTLPPLIRALDDTNNERRKLAHELIFHWVSQREDRVAPLLAQLADAGYSDDDAKLLLALFRGSVQVNLELTQSLLGHMQNPHLAIREQAWRVLTSLAPERPSVYDPTTSPELRAKSIEVIKNRIVKPPKPNLPPP